MTRRDGKHFLRYLLRGPERGKPDGVPVYDHREAVVQAFLKAREENQRFAAISAREERILEAVLPCLNSPARVSIKEKRLFWKGDDGRQYSEGVEDFINLYDTPVSTPSALLSFIFFGVPWEIRDQLYLHLTSGGIVALTDQNHRLAVKSEEWEDWVEFQGYFLGSTLQRVDGVWLGNGRLQHFSEEFLNKGILPAVEVVHNDIVS